VIASDDVADDSALVSAQRGGVAIEHRGHQTGKRVQYGRIEDGGRRRPVVRGLRALTLALQAVEPVALPIIHLHDAGGDGSAQVAEQLGFQSNFGLRPDTTLVEAASRRAPVGKG
jgi:hypothetical protein